MTAYKYFIFSDTHGCYDFLMDSLTAAGFNIEDPRHILVGAGDYFDRGEQSEKLYKFFKSRKLKGRIYLVRGNHDDMLLDFLTGLNDGFFNAIYNGMSETIESFSKLPLNLSMLQLDPNYYRDKIKENYPRLLKWLSTSLKRGFQIDNYKITHAGMSQDDNGNWHINNWTRTPHFVLTYEPDGFTHIFGHWHARQLRGQFSFEASDETFKYKHFIGLDACTNISEFVNVYIVESDQLPIELESDIS